MDDYIKRHVAINVIANAIIQGESLGMGIAEDILYDVPSEDVQPVRHGRWEIYQLAELGRAWTVQCSVCHAIGFHGKTPYCCECGARMDGEKE